MPTNNLSQAPDHIHFEQLKALRRHIGRCIQKVRWEKGITLDSLAKELDEKLDTLDQYEIGKGTISLETLTRIAAVLDVPMSTLVRAGKNCT